MIGEFPIVTTGITYLPIPLGGGIMVLLIIERLWKGQPLPRGQRLTRRDGVEATMDAFVLLASFALFCAVGIPVAYALGLSAIATAIWIDIPLEAVMLKTSDGVDNFSLLAIPFFVMTGALMAEGGTARRLVALAQVFVGFIRGGLAMVNVVAQTLFGCISGSSVADTASIGSVMIPQMIKAGYPRCSPRT